MPIFTANVPCTISRSSGNDVFGQQKWTAPKPAKCAVVKLATTMSKSTVRADSSGSRGHAEQVVADAVLLFKKNISVELDDKITIRGISLRVTELRIRYDVMSRLDHFEARCSIE